MEDISREPVELIGDDLDAVAGGSPFGATADVGATVVNSGHFAIREVHGDFASPSNGSHPSHP